MSKAELDHRVAEEYLEGALVLLDDSGARYHVRAAMQYLETE